MLLSTLYSFLVKYICLRNYNLANASFMYSVLLFWRVYIYILISRTASVGCCFTSQWISPYTADISRMLLRWWKKIFLLYFFTCYYGLENCCDCYTLSRLYTLNLHLQYFHFSRVKTTYIDLFSKIDTICIYYWDYICRFRFERLIYNNTMKILHSRTSDMYCKQIAFSVYTHRKALKWIIC